MQTLPLDLSWPEILANLKEHQNLVLVAEPGAGKTTRFPPALLKSGFIPSDKTVLMLEPRRLAARASAARIAEEQGWTLGREVGYQVRFENRTVPSTRLKVLTEGLLGRRLQNDPELRDVGAVILDEFHERSQYTDLALGLLFELQQLSRPDLRIIVMSATLDAESVSRYLNDAPVVSVPGRTYPVTIHHGLKPLTLESGPILFDRVSEAVLNCIEGALAREGDVLVFLPGTREIRGVRERITDRATRAGFDTVELHGSLALEDQDRAIRRSGSRGKIVLATNIAETSLTIDGIGTVIDSGLARVSRSDAAGFSRLSLSRISSASATQRTGRAGRQGPGICHRLWSKIDESSMPAFEQPEILRTDLSEPLMLLLSQGTREPESFSWFERPQMTSIRSAMRTLEELGFQKNGELTNEGRAALRLPLPVRPARLVLESIRLGAIELGAQLAALVTERDIVTRSADLKRQAAMESDVMLRWHLLNARSDGVGARDVDRFAKQTCLRAAEQIEKVARELAKDLNVPASRPGSRDRNTDELGQKLLLKSYPDRLSRRRRAGDPSAKMIGGKGIRLAQFSSVERAEFFVAIDSMEAPPHLNIPKNEVVVSVASQVELSWIEDAFKEFITEKTETVFDEDSKQVLDLTARFLRDLPLNLPQRKRSHPDQAHEILVQACLDNWDHWLASREDISSIESRLEFLKANGAVPPNEEATARHEFLEEAAFGSTKLDEVLAKPLNEIYLRHLPASTTVLLRNEAPDRLQVPSGSEIKVHYPPERAPYIEVRIQEVFGWTSSPKLAAGKISLQLHLLGPNYRPMQVTSDLASFWQNGYPEVRKELRIKYPKHSWPLDPLTAKPEAKGRRRQ
jgi:ATP-dependent helicase HrpB